MKLKFWKSRKAISPLIATLLLIAVTVSASLIVYVWIMSQVTGLISQVGNVTIPL